MYDYHFNDVWRYISDNELKYSSLYDMQFKKGLPVSEMRTSSLIHEKSFKAIVDLPNFEPKTYNKLLKRIKGVAFAQETGKKNGGFKVTKLPKNFNTWIDYRDNLLASYPDENMKHVFIKRFGKHLVNNYVARQQCRQLILNDYENNLPVDNKEDPRDELIKKWREIL
jgi:predicted phosphoadenosine phosphosulfate sulfurtransferase